MEDFYTLAAAVLGVIIYLVFANRTSKEAEPEIIPPPKPLIPIPEEHERPEVEEEAEQDAGDILAVEKGTAREMSMSELLKRIRSPKEVDDPSKRVTIESLDTPINQPRLDLSQANRLKVKKTYSDSDEDIEQNEDAEKFTKMILDPKSIRDAIIVAELINKKY